MKKDYDAKKTWLRVKRAVSAFLIAAAMVSAIPMAASAQPVNTSGGTTSSSVKAQYGRITSRVNFRTAPSSTAKIISKLYPSDRVKVLRKYNSNWYQVEFKGKKGYLSAKYLIPEVSTGSSADSTAQKAPAGVVASTKSKVNLRSGPGTSHGILKALESGALVKVLKKYDNKWFQIEGNGVKGYVSSRYLTVKGAASVGHVTIGTRLYSTPSYGASIKALPVGTVFTVLGTPSGSWTKVSHNGQVGYVSNSYWASLSQNIPVLSRLNLSRITSKSMVLVNITDHKVILDYNGNTPVLPASVNKLFTIRYALTLMDRGDLVAVKQASLDLTSANGSTARLRPGTYYVRNLIAAMMVPSGNDASYALAAHGGELILGPGHSTQEYVDAFMKGLRAYLKDKGYTVSRPTDPSGDSDTDRSTAWEIYRIAKELTGFDWFCKLVSTPEHTTTLPDGTTRTWRNSNRYLRPEHEFYDPAVLGIKTGSYNALNNLVSAFRFNGKEYIMVSLGSTVTDGRYKDGNLVKSLIRGQ